MYLEMAEEKEYVGSLSLCEELNEQTNPAKK